jgi:cephalosporin hydroxylase
VDRFHELYYERTVDERTVGDTDRTTFWLGHRAVKCPLDLWIYQEIMHERRPDAIVETGTARGGSALFLACMCDLLGRGRVITIDLRQRPPERLAQHPRIDYRTGSSVAPEVVRAVHESIDPAERAMVILDSDHHRDHVLAEMRAYAPLVKPGDYLIVEDTNVNGHPALPDFGPGPMEAVDAFLATEGGFEIDRSREKLLLTFNPRGYLRRREE